MNRLQAETLITEYIKPIFGFALKRCKSIEDAEDLSQEIVLKAYRALLSREDILDPGKFIWTIAHNALSNYYRDSERSVIGISLDELGELIPDPAAEMGDDGDTVRQLQQEIAYLSKQQRRVVIAYYFENRRQSDIARELQIPAGTVKWHLFEAKKELKRGMDTMRKTSELKFNPISFCSYTSTGSVGAKSLDEFFRSPLPQNICYCIRNTAKTVNDIADDLGVSPVYVEKEVEYLEEYGFLLEQRGKYIANFIINEPDTELLALQHQMYHRAAELFANELFDSLTSGGLLDDPDIWCCQSDGPLTLDGDSKADRNFLLWTLIPYIAAEAGKQQMDRTISFEEVATIRPDGAKNIFHASVEPHDLKLPEGYVPMLNWCGPLWNGNGRHILWQIDSEWCSRGQHGNLQYAEDARRVLSLFEREMEEPLSRDEYTWLAELGYIKLCGSPDGHFKSAWQIVILRSSRIRDALLDVGARIKEAHREEFAALKAPYASAAMERVPAHLKKVKAYTLQSAFHDDPLFLIHCITALLQNGKLQQPTQNQKQSLTTLIVKG